MQRWGSGKLLWRLWRSLRQLLVEGWLRGSPRSRPISSQVEQTTTGDRNQSIEKMQGGNAIANARDVYIGSRPTAAGKPFQAPPLPQHYVDRPAVRETVRSLLLEETATASGTLVVSAILGLGGIGKSVLAVALAHEKAVQERFGDGVLWVTLGQQPDVLGLVSSWIQALKDYDYKPTTVEAASSHVRSLLYDKRALLVVDDAWSAEDAAHFLVGGAGCRVLVTTREVVIAGAAQHSLNVMSPSESLALMQNCLGEKWRSHDWGDAVALARSLGYLPLALELAAVLVGEGDTWLGLRREFEQEAANLERLDRLEAENYSTDQQRRKYSLQACFNLSLRRLSRVALGQFAWLGVLPEDVSIEARMAATLWQVSEDEAGRILRYLKGRALLTVGVTTLEGRATYRLHDLMHDAAQSLLVRSSEATELPGLGFSRVAEAHRQLVERYRSQVSHQRWDRLPNDGYIHRHLTWHLENARRSDEIHALMAMSDEQGRNAWFEACDRLEQPAIFVQDVGRGWRCAEECYEADQARSIVLQCRYALITATLNSLVANLPIGMMAEFVKRQYWTPEQAWAYVEQMQDEAKIAEAVEKLAPHVPEPIFGLAVVKARSIQGESGRAKALSALAQIDAAYFTEALEAAWSIQDESRRASALSALAQVDNADFAQLLEAARSIQDESKRASVLSALAQVDNADFAQLLEAARLIQDESKRASALSALAKIDHAYFAKALEAARSIQDEYDRALALGALAQIDNAAYFPEAVGAARALQDESNRAWVFILAQVDNAYFRSEAFVKALSIQDEYDRAKALSALFQIDNAAYFPEAFVKALSIQDEYDRAKALSALVQIDNADFVRVLEAARSIQSKTKRAEALNAVAQIDNAYFAEALEAARSIQDEYNRASVLSALAQIDSAYFSEALAAAQSIQDEDNRASVLSALAQIDPAYFAESLEAARAIQSKTSRAEVLSALAKIDNANFAQLLEAARSIQDEYAYSKSLLRAMAYYSHSSVSISKAFNVILTNNEIYSAFFFSDLARAGLIWVMEAVDFIETIQSKLDCALVLGELACDYPQLVPTALLRACTLQTHFDRDVALKGLISNLPLTLMPHFVKSANVIENSQLREEILSKVSQRQLSPKRVIKQSLASELWRLEAITNKVDQAAELHYLLSRLPLGMSTSLCQGSN